MPEITVDLSTDLGQLETWRQAIGHGGVNSLPLPDRVVGGLARLRPRLIRVFLQEFFQVYPAHGRFDWSRLDAYMDALAATGAKVVAAITIKPKPLYPSIDPSVWRPNDVSEWQTVIRELVRRYSVERPIVSHWEIGNETDIGENGGCPYLIPDPADYAEYYRMTIAPILEVFPAAKVGGCAVADAGGDYLPRFMEECRRDGTKLDFISWHLYHNDPARHAGLVERYRKLLEPFGSPRPEMMVTEWAKGFNRVSVEDMAFEPRRAAIVASCLLSYIDAGVDWTFYYHAWDQTAYLHEFEPFFQKPDIMLHHWNEMPHRFGLFGVGGEVRPQYFVYRLLAEMGGRRVEAVSDEGELRVLASREGDKAGVMLVNQGEERVATLRFRGLRPGVKVLEVRRIDRRRTWDDGALEMRAVERRVVDTREGFGCQVLCPGDSVAQVRLGPAN